LRPRVFRTTNANQNVTALVEPDGTVAEHVAYDPYGKATFYNGSWANPSTTSAYANEVLYTGHRLDPESGLYYTLFRHYHPTLGRWLQRDPLGYVDGMSLYEYVGSNAICKQDSLGLANVGMELQNEANHYRSCTILAEQQEELADGREKRADRLEQQAAATDDPAKAKRLRREADKWRGWAATARRRAASQRAAAEAAAARAWELRVNNNMGGGNGRAAGGNPNDDNNWYNKTWYNYSADRDRLMAQGFGLAGTAMECHWIEATSGVMLVVGGVAGILGEPAMQAGNLLADKPLFSQSYYKILWGATVDLHEEWYGSFRERMETVGREASESQYLYEWTKRLDRRWQSRGQE